MVPESAIYACDCGQRHEHFTDVKDHRFPPLHDSRWRPKAASHPNP
ncbi:hypothetical protein [Streptomyces sp. NPDC049915]